MRRDLAVADVKLLALRPRTVRIGGAVLRITGLGAHSVRMERALGPGGYRAVRGQGGVTAEMVTPGRIVLGDAVVPLTADEAVQGRAARGGVRRVGGRRKGGERA